MLCSVYATTPDVEKKRIYESQIRNIHVDIVRNEMID